MWVLYLRSSRRFRGSLRWCVRGTVLRYSSLPCSQCLAALRCAGPHQMRAKVCFACPQTLVDIVALETIQVCWSALLVQLHGCSVIVAVSMFSFDCHSVTLSAQSLGGETHVVLPVRVEVFLREIKSSCTRIDARLAAMAAERGKADPQTGMYRRLEAVILSASRVHVCNELATATTIADRHCASLLVYGMAAIRAARMGVVVRRVFVSSNKGEASVAPAGGVRSVAACLRPRICLLLAGSLL